MSRSNRRWTSEEAEILRELWNHPDVSIQEICKVLGRSKSGVWNKSADLELGLKALPDLIDRDYLKLLRKQLEVEEG